MNGKFSADEDTVKTICTLAAGDARSALTTLELASEIAVTRPDTEGTPAPAAGERYPITVDDVKIANPRRGFRTTKTVTCTTTSSVRLLSLCAVVTPMPRSIGSRA